MAPAPSPPAPPKAASTPMLSSPRKIASYIRIALAPPAREIIGREVVPRLETVADAIERRPEPREVPQQHGHQAVVVHPVDAGRRVDVGGEVLGDEAVALQPPRRHQDEDPEGGVAEAEAGRRGLAEQADHQVETIDVVPSIGR